MNSPSSPNQRNLLIFILLITVLVRLFTLGAYSLTDTTEARYAEIARKMAETDNWITPQEDYGKPFWAKPPLSTWLTAICFKIFGVNEFAARFSPFLLAIAFGWLTYGLALRQRGRDFALLGSLIFATLGLTFITAGAVMTDGAVALSTTLCMVAFWRAMNEPGRVWGYLFFVGLAAGLLSKGLVPIVLTIFPIGLWVLWKNQWTAVWKRLPWIGGTLLFLALAVPWYLVAEMRTPGFLNYFFIGEHLGKFSDTGWKGDLYGVAHGHSRGTIWVYWLVAALPWSLVVLALVPGILRTYTAAPRVPIDEWIAYLLTWTLAPMIFFTLAGNIMVTYVMPGLPAFALLTAELLRGSSGNHGARTSSRKLRWLPLVGLATPLLIMVVLFTVGPDRVARRSQYEIVKQYQALRTSPESKLVYLCFKPHSAEFYTLGKAEHADPTSVEKFFHNSTQDFFVLKDSDLEIAELAPAIKRMELVGKYKVDYNLMRERIDQ
jgi:4-amino-4-deoxy-L-arabinose transferase-like glycosyltransferase